LQPALPAHQASEPFPLFRIAGLPNFFFQLPITRCIHAAGLKEAGNRGNLFAWTLATASSFSPHSGYVSITAVAFNREKIRVALTPSAIIVSIAGSPVAGNLITV